MTTQSSTTSKTVPFSFYEVVANIFSRYPNPFSSHVQCTDYLEPLKIGPDGSVTCKILNLKTNRLPDFMSRYQNEIRLRYNDKLGKFMQCVEIIEEYKIDLAEKTVWQLSWNASSRNILRTHELVKYSDQTAAGAKLNEPTVLIGHGSEFIKPCYSNNQTLLEKQMVAHSPLHWTLANPIARFATNKWLKQERKTTHGLCYSISKNLYNKNLANEFIELGLNDTALAKLKSKLTLYRTMLYENRHLFSKESRQELIEKASHTFEEAQTSSKAMKQKIKEDIMLYIRNPKFQLMLLEKLKKMPK
jgi:hypothetical protein